ncbi:hypothetical protein [Gilliamella sp. wkB112]|nr:hypothetical protein [Gilliamella apicola]
MNISKNEEKEVTLDLYQLYFDFSKREITIEYYAKDERYPTITINFEKFE